MKHEFTSINLAVCRSKRGLQKLFFFQDADYCFGRQRSASVLWLTKDTSSAWLQTEQGKQKYASTEVS